MRGAWVVAIATATELGACNAAFDLRETQLVDARPDGFVCSHGGAFHDGVRVPIDPAYSVEAARFNRERSLAYLSLCPASGVKGGCDLYSSPYTIETHSFTQYTKLSGVSTPNAYDSYPTISVDGQYMLFGSERSGASGSGVHIWVAAAQASSFDNPVFTNPVLVAGGTLTNEPSSWATAARATSRST